MSHRRTAAGRRRRFAGAAVLLALGFLLAPSGLLAGGMPKSALAGLSFTLVRDNKLVKGGITEKYLLQDQTGQTWIFKPMTEAEAYVEEAAYRLAIRFGLETPEVFSVRSQQGLTGSLVRVLEVRGNLADVPPTDLDQGQLGQLLEIEVFRWLIGDFDSHCRNFLQLNSGDIVTIDHGRAFRAQDFFRYHLDHGVPRDPVSYFEDLWREYAMGLLELPMERTFAFIDRVQSLPEEAVAAILRPLAELRVADLGFVLENHYGEVVYRTPEEFLHMVETRRQRLREDFSNYYARLTGSRAGAAFEPPAASLDGGPEEDIEPVDAAAANIQIHDPDHRLTPGKRRRRRWQAVVNVMRANGPVKVVKRIAQHAGHGIEKLGRGLGELGYRGLSIEQVADLDLDHLPGGKRFLDRLQHTRPEIVERLRERLAYLAPRAESDLARHNAELLGPWIDHFFPPR